MQLPGNNRAVAFLLLSNVLPFLSRMAVFPPTSSDNLSRKALFLLIIFLLLLTPQHAQAAAVPSHLDKLILSFESLTKDKEKGSLRHNWLQLEKQFTLLFAKKNNESAKAAYYAARSREALSLRSFSANDSKEAIKLYEKMALSWPKHPLAPNALFRAATLSFQRLKDADSAERLAQVIIKKYPKSTEMMEAKRLLQSITSSQQTGLTISAPPVKIKKRTRAEQLGLTVKSVMLDAGHGGKDPGAEGNGVTESTVTLSTVKHLGRALEKQGITVYYTRSVDKFLALSKRTELANAKNVDLFISVHVNANADSSFSGIETYYLDKSTSAAASKVAARENGISVNEVSDIQFILTDLILDAKTQESQSLANMIHKGILSTMKTAKSPVDDHGVRTAPFYVLMGARMPSVLVEIGYLTNPNDAKKLLTDAYLAQLASGITKGVINYRSSVSKNLQ